MECSSSTTKLAVGHSKTAKQNVHDTYHVDHYINCVQLIWFHCITTSSSISAIVQHTPSLSIWKEDKGKLQNETQNTCISAKEQVTVSRSWAETPVISVL